MTVVNIYIAKIQLSKLIEEAAAGDVVIARGGKPVARLTRPGSSKRKLKFGILKGKIKISADFDAPLPADAMRQFEGSCHRAAAVAGLPRHHSDPFDRLSLAPAFLEPLRILTSDSVLAAYGSAMELL